jgi:hypothetical protein
MTAIVRQAGGLALAAAIAAGSYAIDVDRSAGRRQTAARIVIRPAPERRVAFGAVHTDRRSRSADRRVRSATTPRAAVPARPVVGVRVRPVAARTVALSAPGARGPARRRDPCPAGRGDPSPSSRLPDSGRPPHEPRVDAEAPHDRDRDPRVDAPGPPDRDDPPPALPTPTMPIAPQPPQTPPAPQQPQTPPAPQPPSTPQQAAPQPAPPAPLPPQTPQQPASQPTPMPPSANPSVPPPSPPPTPPDGPTPPPVTVPTPPTPEPAGPGATEPLPPAPASRPAG